MKAKGIFFDLFGTLFVCRNIDKAWNNWFDAIRSNMGYCGIKMDAEDLKALLDGFFADPVPPENENFRSFTRYERRISNFFRKHEMDIPDEIIIKTADETCDRWSSVFYFEDEVIHVLEHFSRRKKNGPGFQLRPPAFC